MIWIVLDSDPDIARLYPLDKAKQPHIEESIPFIDDDSMDSYLLRRDGLEKISRDKRIRSVAPQGDALPEPNHPGIDPIDQGHDGRAVEIPLQGRVTRNARAA